MTATRLINALKSEGFLGSTEFLTLVRRRQLAERWKAQYQKPPLAVPMKFVSPAPPDEQIRKLIKRVNGILGLFAAAKALGYSHVKGVVPTVWVQSLKSAGDSRGLRVAKEGERPDLFLQQPGFPQSLIRGAVSRDGTMVTDIIQTWLDVCAHPARGAEMASEFENGILSTVIGDRV